MSIKAFLPRVAALFAFAMLVFLNGCGSGSHDSAAPGGRVTVRIVWPEKTTQKASSRYIPSYASSFFRFATEKRCDKKLHLDRQSAFG